MVQWKRGRLDDEAGKMWYMLQVAVTAARQHTTHVRG
jgi:hypothetical protein